MKGRALIIVALIASGCSNRDRRELEQFLSAEREIADRYFSGDRVEAKKALTDLIALERSRGRTVKRYHGSDWIIALSYARLALIAEADDASDDAKNFWSLAAFAARADLPELRGQDGRIAAIRKFLSELERSRPPKWRKG